MSELAADAGAAEQTLVAIGEPPARELRPESGTEELVADKGYHSDETLRSCADKKILLFVSEPQRNRK